METVGQRIQQQQPAAGRSDHVGESADSAPARPAPTAPPAEPRQPTQQQPHQPQQQRPQWHVGAAFPVGADWIGDLNARAASPEPRRGVELPNWAYMSSASALGISAPRGPSTMRPPRA
eukprot:2057494-Pyramimonas_sp.AAC.1